MRWEGRRAEGFVRGEQDGFLLTRVRVGVEGRPAGWFRVFLEGQDAQAMGLRADPDPPLFEDTLDLRQAYVEFFDRRRQGWGVRLGRQELVFGEERLIGAFNWGNTARTFDALRLFYARPQMRVDLFVSSVVVIRDGAFNRHEEGANLHGLYGSFQNLVPQGTVEGYVLWRTRPRVRSERGQVGDADVFTWGTRWVGSVVGGLQYGMELAGQRGDWAGDAVRAWALHLRLGHRWRGQVSPHLLVEYNRASGDRDPQDGRQQTFDQLFPTNHDKYGIADQVGWRNMHNLRVGMGLELSRRVRGQLDYHSFWLVQKRDALYGAGGVPIARIPAGARSGHIGQELDLDFRVTLSQTLSLAAGLAHIWPGGFLKEATPGAPMTWAYTMLSWRF